PPPPPPPPPPPGNFFFTDPATTESYRRRIVGRVRCEKETDREESVVTDENVEATFFCNGGSVSVWVIEDVL
ncbi:hypothetical protein D3H39_07125, partial [Citrobacter portucalensis]